MSNTAGGLSDFIAWILIGDSWKKWSWYEWDEFLCWQISIVCCESAPYRDGQTVHIDHQKNKSNSVPWTYILDWGPYLPHPVWWSLGQHVTESEEMQQNELVHRKDHSRCTSRNPSVVLYVALIWADASVDPEGRNCHQRWVHQVVFVYSHASISSLLVLIRVQWRNPDYQGWWLGCPWRTSDNQRNQSTYIGCIDVVWCRSFWQTFLLHVVGD